MAFSAVGSSGLYQLTMSFKYFDHGWQEKQYLKETSYSAANTTAQTLITHRLKCLPAFCTLTYAKINKVGGARDGQMVNTPMPVAGSYIGPDSVSDDSVHGGKHLNSIEDVVAYRMETDDGNWANRWIHGVPDDEVFADDLVNTIGAGDDSPVADSAISATGGWNLAVENYFKAVRTYCKMRKTVTTTTGDVEYSSDVQTVLSRGLSNRRCGPPFGTKRGRAVVS